LDGIGGISKLKQLAVGNAHRILDSKHRLNIGGSDYWTKRSDARFHLLYTSCRQKLPEVKMKSL
jgi:hypothetical protein